MGQLVRINSFGEAYEFAKVISSSSLVPVPYRNKPENVLLAMQSGSEIGLSPMQSLQSLCVINGVPAIYGDAALALVYASGKLEYIKEYEKDKVAYCEVKRSGFPELVRTFSEEDQQVAQLSKKDIHRLYPKRMRQMRARSFALRDSFPDVLKGIGIVEEVEDYNVLDNAGSFPAPQIVSNPTMSDAQWGILINAARANKWTNQNIESFLSEHGLQLGSIPSSEFDKLQEAFGHAYVPSEQSPVLPG